MPKTSSSESFVMKTEESSKDKNSQSENTSGSSVLPTNTEYLQALKDDKESIRSFQKFMSRADHETLASVGGGKVEGISPDMVKTASNVISSMLPEEFERMLEMATSFQGNNANLDSSSRGPGMPNVTPDMFKSATDMMNKMPPEELQKMVKTASLTERDSQSNEYMDSDFQERPESLTFNDDIGESSTSRGVLNSRNTPQPSFPGSSLDMQEQITNQMINLAMSEMMSSMMESISPDMIAIVSEQFGYKLSHEDAERVQQTMSSFSPDSFEKMMKWGNRILRGVEGARNTKNWLLGRQGLALALVILLLAILLNWLGFIGH